MQIHISMTMRHNFGSRCHSISYAESKDVHCSKTYKCIFHYFSKFCIPSREKVILFPGSIQDIQLLGVFQIPHKSNMTSATLHEWPYHRTSQSALTRKTVCTAAVYLECILPTLGLKTFFFSPLLFQSSFMTTFSIC